MRDLPAEGEIYRHFKGNLYRIICIARDSETAEEMVVYENRDDVQKKYVRPLRMFMSETDHDKYPDVSQKYRFEKVSGDNMVHGGQKEQEAAASGTVIAEKKEEDSISPGLMAFLDAETYEEKLDVLYRIRASLDDDTVNAIALSLDTEIRDGSISERYEEIRNYILTMIKYEGARLRR